MKDKDGTINTGTTKTRDKIFPSRNCVVICLSQKRIQHSKLQKHISN
jgi:hypothetical protein